MSEDDLPPLTPEDAAEAQEVADELMRGATSGARARQALGTSLETLRTGQLPAVTRPTRRSDGRPRGIAALIPDGNPNGSSAKRRPAGFSPPAKPNSTQTASASAIAARMVEGDWLVCVDDERRDDGLLHHGRLVPAQLTSLAVHGLAAASAEHVLMVTCMRLRTAASRPGEVHRRSRLRCRDCCITLGYPLGYGSPSVDEHCAAVLERRLEGLG